MTTTVRYKTYTGRILKGTGSFELSLDQRIWKFAVKRVRVFCNCHTRGVEKSHLGSQVCHLSGNLWLSCLALTVVVCVSIVVGVAS